MSDIPVYEADIFSDEAIVDPYPHYARIRELGPVVRLAAQDILAAGRYDDVKAVLANHDCFRSGSGVLWSENGNRQTIGTMLASDPPLHDHLRQVVAHRLTPRALRDEHARVNHAADVILERVLSLDSADGVVELDAVTEIAQAMPMSVVPDFMGFPEECRGHLLAWGDGALESGGPPSERTPAAVAKAIEVGRYAEHLATARSFPAGTLGAELIAAVDRGEIEQSQCPALFLDYFGPSLETTISALGSALGLFAENPEQWQLLRRDPSLVAGAFNETVRLESPLRGFTRLSAKPATVGGVAIPGETRVALLFASANRDSRKWTEPDRFDITRANADQLGLGYGVHGRAGQGLARLEIGAVLSRLAQHVSSIEFSGHPIRKINSLVRAYAHLPLRLHFDPSVSSAPGTTAQTMEAK